MRVVLISFCQSAAAYLEALVVAKTPPVLLATAPSSQGDALLDSLCARAGVPIDRSGDTRDPAFIERVSALRPDLLLVAGCPQILRPAILDVPRLGALNVHPSLLPHYRGKEPLFWTILRGETRSGITIHRVTEEVDGGPIILQRAIDVPPRATSATLARALDELGASCIDEVVTLARSGSLPEGAASPEAGSAFPALSPAHGLVDWSRSAVEIERLARAAEGATAAFFFYRGMRIVLLEADVAEARDSAAPGTVIAQDDRALVIATGEGAVAATRFRFVHRAHDGRELAAALGIATGDRLTSNPAF